MEDSIEVLSENSSDTVPYVVEEDTEVTEVEQVKNSQETNVPEKPSRKRTYEDMDGRCEVERDREEGLLCPVCLDAWTSAGPHRLCSLKCGHLFGFSCVERWLSGRQNKSCPTCNARAKKSDIRGIYATTVTAIDNTETEELKRECLQLKNENIKLKKQVDLQIAVIKCYKDQVDNFSNRMPQQSDLPQVSLNCKDSIDKLDNLQPFFI